MTAWLLFALWRLAAALMYIIIGTFMVALFEAIEHKEPRQIHHGWYLAWTLAWPLLASVVLAIIFLSYAAGACKWAVLKVSAFIRNNLNERRTK